jgi:HD-GYP domain-containing protein (c-di-GMP phosphodiesterase class II)
MLAEQLVGEARARRQRRMPQRERKVRTGSAVAFLAVAAILATTLPYEREAKPLLTVALVAAYAVVSRVRFEFGDTYVVPEQLLFVPMLFLVPLPLVPFLVAAAAVLSIVPDMLDGRWHSDRWVTSISDCWFAVGPVVVLGLLAPGVPHLADSGFFALAFAAQLAGDASWMLIRDHILDRLPLKVILTNYLGVARIEATYEPIGFLVTLAAVEHPLALVALAPFVWMLNFFSRDREARYAATLELHRAYRGTVMLLADVVEFEDKYTANHSRSVVDLVHAVAEEIGVDRGSRQELEFAALLHDVGKISISKEILHKPAALTREEFELVKTHTIEGQFMLDRVGGLLARVGEIVRSCHERWDGTGYPDGLKGDEIPLAARIVFACDAYNAMTTDRPYRAATSPAAAVVELRANAGTQFDPRVVGALVKIVEEGEPEPLAADHVRAVLAQTRVGTA